MNLGEWNTVMSPAGLGPDNDFAGENQKQQTLQNTYGRNKGICEQTRIQTDIYLYPIVVWKSDVLRGFTGLHFSFVSLVLSSKLTNEK
jgi:hypothetical protein